MWRKITHLTKSFDIKLQNVQKLILDSLILVSNIANDLFNSRVETNQQKIKYLFKNLIKHFAETALLLGKVKY